MNSWIISFVLLLKLHFRDHRFGVVFLPGWCWRSGQMFSSLYLNSSVRPGEHLQEHLNTPILEEENSKSSFGASDPSSCDNADIPGLTLLKIIPLHMTNIIYNIMAVEYSNYWNSTPNIWGLGHLPYRIGANEKNNNNTNNNKIIACTWQMSNVWIFSFSFFEYENKGTENEVVLLWILFQVRRISSCPRSGLAQTIS